MCGYDSHQALHTSRCWNGPLRNGKPEKKCGITAPKMETVLLFVCVYDTLVNPPTTAKEQFLYFWVVFHLNSDLDFRLHALLSTGVHVARGSVGRGATRLHAVADATEPSGSSVFLYIC